VSDGETLTHTLVWHQDASEIQECHVFKLDNADPVEIDRITVQFAAGSHHVHIYRSDTPEPDGVADCWQGIDWLRWHLVLGVQTEQIDWKLPSGLTVPLDAHQQLLVQVHWLNTTDAPIDGKIDISMHTTMNSDAHVGVMFGINKQTAMQPHEHKVLRQWCAMPDGAQVLAMMGHYHGLGQAFTVNVRAQDAPPGDQIYDALDDQTFRFKLFDPAYSLPSGDGLEFECDFFNSRDWPITWSSDTKTGEHCNMVAYYYPAIDISTFCIVEATEVQTITGPTAPVIAGDLATYTIDLSGAALTGGADVKLASSDPTVVAVPDSRLVAEGQTTATFRANALRPGRVTLTATLGTTSQSTTLRVGGLVLSEVYVGTAGQTDQRQWVELANTSNVAIDLSRYSLGGGSADYTQTRSALHITLPPSGCVVVGGPQLTSIGQPPYDEAFDFAPDLGLGAVDANGIGLFDVTADQIGAQTLPYDTLVYGIDNNKLLDPVGQLAQVVAPCPAGGTYFRRIQTHWETQPVATPRICEVLL